MPSELAWPIGSKGPLAFIAQIDLAEVRAAGGLDWLPPTGVLFIFNDDERYGFPDHMKVLLSPGLGEAEQEPPAPLHPEHEFNARPVLFTPARSLPSIDWLDLSPKFCDSLEDLYRTSDDLYEVEPDHRIGGYPAEIQSGSLALECASQARRFYGLDTPEPPEETPWRLLLQVDSDDELGFLWADGGRLYLFVREADARAGDFSKIVASSQCY